MLRKYQKIGLVLLFCCFPLLSGCDPSGGMRQLHNVSYDPTFQFYTEYNAAFVRHWYETTGETVRVRQSHGGSGKQSRSIIDGNNADVATLALAFDIDSIARANPALLDADWQQALPNNSCPYTSTIVFLVRSGNPRGIQDWDCLLRPDIQIVTPDPHTSGGARWNYLAAWGFILHRELDGDWGLLHDPAASERIEAAQAAAFEFVTALFNNRKSPIKDVGARGSTVTFVDRRQGDVLLAWENEAILVQRLHAGGNNFEIVTPSVSILAEPAVAVITGYARRNGKEDLAEAYLLYLYSDEGQQIIARHHYRPYNQELLQQLFDDSNSGINRLELFTVDEVFGGWTNAHSKHFDRGGTYERIAMMRM